MHNEEENVEIWSIAIRTHLLLLPEKPEYLHRKHDKLKLAPLGDQSHYNIAHRGGSLEKPENTLQAFRYSVSNNGIYLFSHNFLMPYYH